MNNDLSRMMVGGAMLLVWASLGGAADPATEAPLFQEEFQGPLRGGWFWEREDRACWRVGPPGLEVRVQPGNMWGAANNAKNVLVHPIPAPVGGPVEIAITFSNFPTAQWEQANLVWFYDDSNMVKLGQELVTGRLSVVMGREEGDRARTVAIVPCDGHTVELRLQAVGNRVRGQFRTPPWRQWRYVGECDLPAKGEPKASLQFYNGPANEAHWVRANHFTVRRLLATPVDWLKPRVAENVQRGDGRGVQGGLGTLGLQGGFELLNDCRAVAGGAKADFEQQIYAHQDGAYGWSWDRRASDSKEATSCGVMIAGPGKGKARLLSGLANVPGVKSFELELEAVTRLENDRGDHNLAVVVSLSASALAEAPPTHRLALWFDWYGKTSDTQTLNDGYRDYGLVSKDSRDIQYRIKGFRGAPPRINLKAFLDDLAQRDKLRLRVLNVWFGNEIWNGSRGATLVNQFDCVIDGMRYASAPAGK